MRELAKAALLAIAIVTGALTPAFSQATNNPPTIVLRGAPITPLGWFVIGSIGCAAVSPIIGTVILGRELTMSEAYHTTLGCILGPVGRLLADAMFPPTVTGPDSRQPTPPRKPRKSAARGGHIEIPSTGETRFVPNEILLAFAASATERDRALVISRLQLSLLETQTFSLTGRTIGRYRIDAARSVPDTLRLARNLPGISSGQANKVYAAVQNQPEVKQDTVPDGAAAQYVVRKLHLLEAHRINRGDDVLVAVIDSKIDAAHPDLAGVISLTNSMPLERRGLRTRMAPQLRALLPQTRSLSALHRKSGFWRCGHFRAPDRARKARLSISSRVLIGQPARTRASST
jgi:hypothetical protein